MQKFLQKYKSTMLYGISLALLLFLMKWLEFRFMVINHTLEIYIGLIAIIFTALGIWLALKLTKPKKETIIIEKEIYVSDAEFIQDRNQLEKLNLSKREMEVLELIAQGCSNQEIASQLFVSLPTIKSHSSKLFEKLDVNRRTQAVEKAKRLKLIP
ncbi:MULTISPECIES: response regulator transcription factor [Flavobacterium]|uniref:LuxR family transcriptional regulator n=1 Tax=Flavobacterium lindanitolerans TaxID=428988 RepID=A0A497UNQ4_9FLAO|nr:MULTISPECIES: LuxR C-terminal-related transcriptional regulator [Flavobacterium]MBC8644170.1 DNA-binding response regulator [Flavobacterium lindanitolerans]MDQ7960456.1 LuxR C-terminal-related transcriptional regulator [Flavobacterium lindanitolerans]OJX55150.1 MAG: helix-turn-helix transcriptional regulator [Flavobacterium sp. 38-13]PKW21254.1 LuxR family transcriptional regulator [Flavobacterium lindanitolerans]RLJ30108.1 regulatory LuxR family protein [Flavobacterium lindanitolerans]